MSDTATPEPAVGQVWADNDYRSAGRTIRIERIENYLDGSGRYAVALVLTNADDGSGNRRGSLTRINVRRLRPTSNGYRYLRTEGGAPDA